MKKILAWHFLKENRMLRDGSLLVEPGYVYSIGKDERVDMCSVGMHASVKAMDALRYAPGPIVCRVLVWGGVATDGDKIAGRHREVLWMADATETLHSMVCWCVRETPLADGRKVWDLLTDERSRQAVIVKERWLRGEATDEELDAARDAARAAAWDAAWDAAWAAAWAATRAAARAAAWDAAWAAAWDAAWAATGAASWAATRAAARAAAGAAQNTELTRRLLLLGPKGAK